MQQPYESKPQLTVSRTKERVQCSAVEDVVVAVVVGARGVVVVVEDVVVVDAVAVVEAVVVGVQRVVTAPGAVLPEELQLLLPTAAVGTVRQPVPCCSPD